MQQMKVKLFTLSTCSHCKAAKKFLNDIGVEYEYTDVDLLPPDRKSTVTAELRKLNPMVSFPTIIIGSTVIVGNKENEIRKALGL